MSAVMEEPVVMGWREARAQGLKHYFTGQPCPRGHVAVRAVGNRICLQCNRINSAEYRTTTMGLIRPKKKGRIDTLDKDPDRWDDDSGAKRVAIYDHNHNPPRLVRKVGWVNCLSPYSVERRHRFFSGDVQRVRMCPYCKTRVDTAHHGYRD
jgi:hypothetical protein